MHLIDVLTLILLLLPGSETMSPSYLEKFRLLHESDYVDTAVVKFSHPGVKSFRRFTKREALNLQGSQELRLTITLTSSKKVLEVRVQRTDTVHREALVVEHIGDRQQSSRFESKGCHYKGTFQTSGVASLHICDGLLVAGAYDDVHEYVIHPLPQYPGGAGEHMVAYPGSPEDSETPAEPGAESLGTGRVVVTWKKIGFQSFSDDRWVNASVHGPIRSRRQAEQSQSLKTAPSSEDDDDEENASSTTSDEKTWEGEKEQDVDDNGRRPMTAEFAVVLDEDYISDLRKNYGYNSTSDVVNFVAVKFSGMQAVYGNPEAVGVVFNILVMKIDIFWENPGWYRNQKDFNTKQVSRARTVCSNYPGDAMKVYDSVAVLTQNISGKIGVAYASGVCSRAFKCFISKITRPTWLIEAHEFGHTLGMVHDWSGCGPIRGFLRGNQNMFLPCYREFLLGRVYDPKIGCLYVRSVPTGPVVELQKTFPVLALGLDKLCETSFMGGSENVRQLHDGPCSPVYCAMVNTSDKHFGLMGVISDATVGRPCGENQVCLRAGQCVDITNQTTISLASYLQNRRAGGWSEWSSFTNSCSSDCGTGLLLASRMCNKPTPLMENYCQGSKFKAILCNTEPCPGDHVKSDFELKQDRATYTCGQLLRRRIIKKEKFTSMGDNLHDNADAAMNCAVGCREASSPFITTAAVMAFQPDGAPCGTKGLDYYLRGIQHRCMRGLCTGFGCNNRSMDGSDDAVVKDLCGVCGGDNSSCSYGITDAAVPAGQRVRIFHLAAGTKDILIVFNYNDHASLATELYSKDEQPVIKHSDPQRRVMDNSHNPENFAGAYWVYVHQAQFLSATGMLTQPVVLRLYNSGSKNITQTVTWRFDSPISMPVVKCSNGGTPWLGGCLCKTNVYGATCTDTCSLLCHNGGYVNDQRCARCTCSEYAQGRFCERCVEGRRGPDCRECVVKVCYNGGVHDTHNCTCSCPAGCRGKDCSDCSGILNTGYSATNYRDGRMYELEPVSAADDKASSSRDPTTTNSELSNKEEIVQKSESARKSNEGRSGASNKSGSSIFAWTPFFFCYMSLLWLADRRMSGNLV